MAASAIATEMEVRDRATATKTKFVNNLSRFDLREKLGAEDREIVDDRTEEFLNNRLLFLAFGIIFCWMVVKSLGATPRK